jgi:pimeloyl-ACP methyl ester carboxylesterase
MVDVLGGRMKKTIVLLFTVILLAGCSSARLFNPYPDVYPMEFSELSYPYKVHNVTTDAGIQLAYMDEGSGDKTILFIHGLGSYAKAWQKNIAALKENFRCIAVDLPGYGKSDKGDYAYSMTFYGEQIKSMIAKLNLQNVYLAGHSMGGQIAMVTGLRYPDLIKGLILINPAGFEEFSEGEKEWFREVMTVDLVKLTPVQTIRANVVTNFYEMPEDAEFMITDRIALRGAKDFEWYCYAVTKSVAGMVDQPVIHKLGKIRQPTLIIFGENDNLIPNPFLHGGTTLSIAQIGADKIPDNQLLMLAECGHFSQFERPVEVNNAIIDFVK